MNDNGEWEEKDLIFSTVQEGNVQLEDIILKSVYLVLAC